MKTLTVAVSVLFTATMAVAKPPRKNLLTSRFIVTNLGAPGDRVAFSPLGTVAVGYALKSGYVRTPNGKKTPLQEGLLPWTMTSKGTIGGQLGNRAVILKGGKLEILFPDKAADGPTAVPALTDTSSLMIFARGKVRANETPPSMSWEWVLISQGMELSDKPEALAEDGWYVTSDSYEPERVLGNKRQKLIGLAGQDWTHATHVARGGLACGYTESSGPGYINAVWWDAKGDRYLLSPPAYGGRSDDRKWYGARADRINARGDVIGTATLEGKWPVGLRTSFCRRLTDLTILWPRGGKPIVLDDLFRRSAYGSLNNVEGIADNGTLLVRTRSGKQERLLLLKPR